MAQAVYLTSVVKVSQDDLSRLSANAIPEDGDPRQIEISGKCPRCPHDIHYVLAHREWGLADEVGTGGGAELSVENMVDGVIERLPSLDEIAKAVRARFADDGPHDRDVALQCNCGIQHKAGKTGCGAWFGLNVHWDRGLNDGIDVTLAQATRPITQLEIARAQERDAREASQLTRFRGAGGKVSAGLLAIAAAIPGFVIVKGAENVKDLPDDSERWVQWLLIAAFLGIAGASIAFIRVTTGPIRAQESTDDPTAARDRELRFSSRLLRFSIGAFILGAACLAAAFAITMFTEPESDPSPAQLTVTRRNGSAECGSYVRTVTDPPSVRVKKSDGSTVTIPIGDVEKLEFTTTC
jgi:hypothetical protein